MSMRRWMGVAVLVFVVGCRSEAPAPSTGVATTAKTTAAAKALDTPAPSASTVGDDRRQDPTALLPGPGGGEDEGKKGGTTLMAGQLSVTGRLPPEVIQRVVRGSFSKIRACYETGLKTNPKLAGKVAVRFVIAREGNVSSAASDADTTITDGAVVTCVVGHFKALTFPQPEGGIVTVVYPLTFSHEE